MPTGGGGTAPSNRTASFRTSGRGLGALIQASRLGNDTAFQVTV